MVGRDDVTGLKISNPPEKNNILEHNYKPGHVDLHWPEYFPWPVIFPSVNYHH